MALLESAVDGGGHPPRSGGRVPRQTRGPRSILDVHSRRLRGSIQRADQPRTFPLGLDDQPAPKPVPAVHQEGLPVVRQHELDPPAAQPLHRGERLGHQGSPQGGIRFTLRHPPEISGEVLFRVSPDLDLVGLFEERILHDLGDVIEAPVGKAKRPGGHGRVTPARLGGRPLQQQHPGLAFGGGERRAQPGVAAPNDDDVLGVHDCARRSLPDGETPSLCGRAIGALRKRDAACGRLAERTLADRPVVGCTRRRRRTTYG